MIMNMPGKPVEPEPSTPPREFTFNTWGGRGRTIHADEVEFTAHHVVFWKGSEEAENLFLVEAVQAASVNDLTEVENLL